MYFECSDNLNQRKNSKFEIFKISKFRNIGRSTFGRSKFWPRPLNFSRWPLKFSYVTIRSPQSVFYVNSWSIFFSVYLLSLRFSFTILYRVLLISTYSCSLSIPAFKIKYKYSIHWEWTSVGILTRWLCWTRSI